MDLTNQIELELYFSDHFDTILFPVLANIYLKQGDLSRAKKVCEIGLKNHRDDPEGLFILAQVNKLEGNLKISERILEQIITRSPDHLGAVLLLCEIQTVLGRATSRLLKSWKQVLIIDPDHKDAKKFIQKVDGGKKTTLKQSSKKVPIQPKSHTSSAPKYVKEPIIVEEYEDPLKVSPRLATFTLVSVLKNQGLFSQALEILDALEKKGESKKAIDLERETIKTLIKNLQKE